MLTEQQKLRRVNYLRAWSALTGHK